MKVSYEIRSEIGSRDEQQDYASVVESRGMVFAVVCDGMGGHRGGALASQTAADEFAKRFRESCGDNIPAFYIDTAETVNSIVYNLKGPKNRRLNAGTTIVSVVVNNNDLYWLSIGDSRLYIIRDKKIKQITKDHNLFLILDEMLRNGQISKEQYINKCENGNALTSFLGLPSLELIDMNVHPFLLQQEDIIIIATDGLYKSLNEEQILQCADSNIKESAEKLIRAVIETVSESKDNTSFIIMNVTE